MAVNSKTCPSCGRVATNPGAGFCGRCGVKLPAASGGGRIWGTVLGSVLGVLLIFWLIGVLYSSVPRSAPAAVGSSPPATEPAASAPAPPPLAAFFDLAIRKNDSESVNALRITLIDQSPTAIQRVVINGRTGEKGCDFTREEAVKGCLNSVKKSYGPEAVAAAVGYMRWRSGGEQRFRENAEVQAMANEVKRALPKELEAGKAACIKGEGFKSEGSDSQRVPPWPQTLKTGDSLNLDSVSCGDKIVSVRISTDRGEATFQNIVN